MAILSLEKLIEEFRKMPSVGVKSAERMEQDSVLNY